MVTELSPAQIRRAFDPATLGFGTTAEIEPMQGIIGQDRALRALRFGLGIREQGFNVFVSGLPGTGRTSAVKAYLEEIAKGTEVPSDWCYVNNFKDTYRPKALKFPPGAAKQFQTSMRHLIDAIKREVPRVFESDQYNHDREEETTQFSRQREEIVTTSSAKAVESGFSLQPTPQGLMFIPLKEGRPYTDEELAALSDEEKAALRQKRSVVEEEVRQAMRQVRAIEKAATERLENYDKEVAMATVGALVTDLADDYHDDPAILEYLEGLQNDIVENIGQFRPEAAAQPQSPQMPWLRELAFRKYDVNVIVDNSALKGEPVILEFNPTYNYLFGRIEKEAQFGALVTDFTLIRPGSLHLANGGFLVCEAEELLRNPFSWDELKRALRNRDMVIEDPGEKLGFMVTKSLMPEPIPMHIKVILIGTPWLYQALYSADPDFKDLFKVKADFDSRMDLTPENIRAYVASLRQVCCQENLRDFTAPAMARVLEESIRMAGDWEKLSTRFSAVSDIMREAAYWAAQDDAPQVEPIHIDRAVEESIYRSNLTEEHLRDAIAQGIIKIDTAGAAIGQVNGLAVVGAGDVNFGRPSRITVSLGVGREGVVDIEREVKTGGPSHTKGVMILSGFLAERFAQDKPLTLSARLVFEQSYDGIDGDSASSTELYAILSRLSGAPIKQSIAVTGSVNQRGEVQAIGGVNEKIEGYFAVCKVLGLNGKQGVMIPASNVRHLMLKREIVEAVRAKLFHIYTAATIDEGIEVLTGVPAGRLLPDGKYPEGSINYLVDQKLRGIAKILEEFSKSGKDKKDGSSSEEAKGKES
jgi:predicted ATP-dependent protease